MIYANERDTPRRVFHGDAPIIARDQHSARARLDALFRVVLHLVREDQAGFARSIVQQLMVFVLPDAAHVHAHVRLLQQPLKQIDARRDSTSKVTYGRGTHGVLGGATGDELVVRVIAE